MSLQHALRRTEQSNVYDGLSAQKSTKGSTNLAKAVTFGMPKGRGRKGEKAPRKKGKGKKQSPLTVVPRIVPSPNCQTMDVEELSPSS